MDREHGPDRPFCSDRCRLIDLGAWLTDGARAIPGRPAIPDATPDADQPDDDAL